MDMQFEFLEQNVIEVMEEQQAKLGFDGNAVYLFYPLSSLAALLGVSPDKEEILRALAGFCAHVRERLGQIAYVLKEGRVSLEIPPEGGAYVQAQMNEEKFIVRLIKLIGTHHARIEDVIALFKAYSDCVHAERMPQNEEFDWLVYFADGKPDAFFYCLKDDMGHVTYHRFTREDYEAFGF